MRTLIALIALLVLTSCDNPVREIYKDDAKIKTFTIIEYEGCEYICATIRNNTYGTEVLFAHKGNCKNPIHIYSKIEPEIKVEVNQKEYTRFLQWKETLKEN